ncbi:MAG: hypothetical protein ACI9SQ_001489 [Rubritalea sp.]|jgi:hypothetical protein
MKSPILYALFLTGLTATSSFADTMQGLKDKGWASYYAGFQGSGYEVAIDTKGQIEFYFTPRKGERLNRAWPVEAQLRIERREKGESNWVQKTTKADGFTPMEKVEFDQENIEYLATVTGGVQFKVMVTFDRNGLNIQSEMVGKPEDADKADYQLVLETDMPTLMTGSSKYDEKELKDKTRGDEVRIEFKEEKGQRIRLYEVADAQKITTTLPTSIMLNADKIGRKKLTWSILDRKDKGTLELDFKSTSKRFLDGFNIRVVIVNEKGEQLTKGIRMEYK